MISKCFHLFYKVPPSLSPRVEVDVVAITSHFNISVFASADHIMGAQQILFIKLIQKNNLFCINKISQIRTEIQNRHDNYELI